MTHIRKSENSDSCEGTYTDADSTIDLPEIDQRWKDKTEKNLPFGISEEQELTIDEKEDTSGDAICLWII